MNKLFSGITVKGLIAVIFITLGAFGILGGIAVVLLGIIEGKPELLLGGIIAFVAGAIAGRIGSWLYDGENMNEEI